MFAREVPFVMLIVVDVVVRVFVPSTVSSFNFSATSAAEIEI
jgi:hypothetical protein